MTHAVIFRSLLKGATRDAISIGWAVAFPIILIIGMHVAFGDALDKMRLLAGTVAFSTIFFAVHGTGFDILSQRTRGVYKLLRASPYPVAGFILWLGAARGALTVLAALLVAGLGGWWLGIALTPTLLIGLGVSSLIGAATFTALGVIMGNLGDNEGAVAAWNNLVTFPLLFLTETFYSLANAPAWLQIIRDLLPFNHYLWLAHHLAAGEWSAAGPELLIVLGFGIFFVALAVLTFRWDPAQPFWEQPAGWRFRRATR